MNKKGLYKFYWDCGRMGHLDGLFIATKEDIFRLIGSYIYFGEILGKHSEIDGTVEADDIILLTNSEEVIKVFEDNNISVGYNPLNYLDDSEDEDEE